MNRIASIARSLPSRSGTVTLTLCALVLIGCTNQSPSEPGNQTDPLDGERINSFYTNEEIRYFLDIAVGDTGTGRHPSEQALFVKKWYHGIGIALEGSPTVEDLETVYRVINELDEIIPEIPIWGTSGSGHVTMYFVPQDKAHIYLETDPGYGSGAWIWFGNSFEIIEGAIHIPTDSTISQHYREELILRRITSTLGFLDRTDTYPESIFYSNVSLAYTFAPIDRTIIRMLYLPEIEAGMTRNQVIRALTNR